MALKLSNNADGLLALAISDSDTSLTLRAGHGSRFPALGSGDWFPITVVRASDPSQFEIMRCTARTLDTLTVERAQEGTSALAFDPGDVVSLRLTSGTLEENFPQVEGRNAKNLRFSIDSVGGKPELKFKSGDDEETVVRRSDLTTSPTDTTAGRVLKVGDFGVGATIWINQGENLNDFTTPGEYHQSANANAIPELNYPAQLAGSLKVMRAASGVVQEYTTYGNTRRKFLRGLYNGSWSSWVEFYHTGNIAQLISDKIGELKGKRMLFLEATAPPGWTQDTSINDRVLRIVNSAGGGLGGSWTISGLSASVSVGATTLSVSQIPSHSHTVSLNQLEVSGYSGYFVLAQGNKVHFSTGATGGSGSHTHSASASISSNGTWRPAYVDVIACRKD